MSRRARARFDRRVILNPMAVATENAGKLAAYDRLALQGIIKQAFSEFTCGRDCAAQWCVLADALNVAERLSIGGICSDAASRGLITAGLGVLLAAHQRQHTHGTWALRGPELSALGDAVWLAGVQLDYCSLGEYQRAVRDTEERMRQARAGNVAAGVVVLQGALA